MISIWYDAAWGATFAQFNGTRLRFFDRESPREVLKQITKGSSCVEVPYSKEVWDSLLAEGEEI
jgi:hypothetical protein